MKPLKFHVRFARGDLTPPLVANVRFATSKLTLALTPRGLVGRLEREVLEAGRDEGAVARRLDASWRSSRRRRPGRDDEHLRALDEDRVAGAEAGAGHRHGRSRRRSSGASVVERRRGGARGRQRRAAREQRPAAMRRAFIGARGYRPRGAARRSRRAAGGCTTPRIGSGRCARAPSALAAGARARRRSSPARCTRSARRRRRRRCPSTGRAALEQRHAVAARPSSRRPASTVRGRSARAERALELARAGRRRARPRAPARGTGRSPAACGRRRADGGRRTGGRGADARAAASA